MQKTQCNLGLTLALLMSLAMISGCETNMQEPWVPDPEVLKQERERNADQQKLLRERLAQVQTDR